MRHLGDYAAGSTLYFTFSTHKADGTPITLAGTPSLAVYKADGTAQSTTGITLTTDFDSVTGLHSVKIECTDAFYAVGNDYSVVIAAGTVDSISVVGYTIATFSIENRNTKADVVAISGDTTAADNAELMFDGTGYAGGTTKLQTAVASIATDAITAASIKADAITKIQAGLSTHSAADVKTAIEAAGSSIASILADTAELQTDWVNGGRLDLLIDAIKAKTDTYVVPPTTSEIKTALEIAGGTLALILADTGELQTDWVNGGRLDALIDAIKAKTDTIPANPAQVGSAMTLTAAYDNAKLAWSTLTAQQVWEHSTRTLSSFGTLVADTATAVWTAVARTITDKTGFALTAAYDAAKTAATQTSVDAIQADTDDIQTRLPAALVGGKMDAVASVVLSGEDIANMADSISTTIAATLGGQTITVVSPTIDSGTIQIVPGDTYNPDKANRLIRFTNTGSWSDLTSATVTIEWTGTGTATCEVAAAGGSTTEQIVDVPLSVANTLAIEEGPFRIYATWDSPADVETLVIGHIVLSGKTI